MDRRVTGCNDLVSFALFDVLQIPMIYDNVQ